MKRKNLEFMKSSTYRRFFFSYVWVLIIPLMAFTLIYTQYYEKMYRNKILEQSETALELSMQELQKHIEEFITISAQNSILDEVKGYHLKKDILNIQIKNLLASQTLTHSFLHGIDYYNEEIPYIIYTMHGTCSPKYYYQYLAPDGSYYSLPQFLSQLETNGWISSEQIQGKDSASAPYLQYVVKMAGSMKAYWIFTISNEDLSKLVNVEEAITVLYDVNGKQIYPFGESFPETGEPMGIALQSEGEDWAEGYCRIEASSEEGDLKLVRIIRNDYLFLELNRFRIGFLMIVLLILVLGGLFVALLSFYNNRPISELEAFCEKKLEEIPKHIKGMEIFRFTLDKMEERVALLEQKQIEERLLLQILYGKNCNTDYFNNAIMKAKLFLEAECFRVIVVSLPEDGIGSSNVLLYFDMLLDKKYELYMMEYSKQNVIVGLIGMKESDDVQLREQLDSIALKICEGSRREIQIFVGGKCEKKADIHWSYMQSLMLSQKGRKQTDGNVYYFEENTKIKMRFMYPKLELDSLYDALIAADFNKANLITDILVDTIREQSYNRFVCTTLCYDVINAYYRAQTELEFQKPNNESEIDLKSIDGIADVEEMVKIILRIREESRAYMEKGAQEAQTKDIATRVITFIDQNYKDSQLCVSMVADTFRMSISNLSHQFKALTNINISDYITDKKFNYVKELLLDTDYSVKSIAGMLGYNQTTSFIRKFKQYYGMTPSEYRGFYQKGVAASMKEDGAERNVLTSR